MSDGAVFCLGYIIAAVVMLRMYWQDVVAAPTARAVVVRALYWTCLSLPIGIVVAFFILQFGGGVPWAR